MSIKARVNTNDFAVCDECGADKEFSLDLFDYVVGGKKFTLCDACNQLLFNKTLNAVCYENHKPKLQRDKAVMRRRKLNG